MPRTPIRLPQDPKPSDYVEAGWTQMASARRYSGEIAAVNSEYAVCWCAVGAIVAANYQDDLAISEAFEAVRGVIEGGEITEWNDAPERTQKDVVETLRRVGL